MTLPVNASRGARLALLILVLSSLPMGVAAISDENDTTLFGPVGVSVAEGVRVNILAIGDPDSIGDPGIRIRTFTIRVFTRSGRLAIERRVDVMPGAFVTVALGPLDPAQFPPDSLGRRTLRAEIVGFNPQPDPPGRYAATLEVFGLFTGQTHIALGGPDTLPAGIAR